MSQTIRLQLTQNPQAFDYTNPLNLAPSSHRADISELWCCALTGLQFYNSTINLTGATVTYTIDGGSAQIIPFPEGLYSIETLTEELKSQMIELGHFQEIDAANNIYSRRYYFEFLPDLPTGRSYIRFIDADAAAITVTLSSNLAEILGFSSLNYNNTGNLTVYGDLRPQFNSARNPCYKVQCNFLASQDLSSPGLKRSLYVFYPQSGASTLITERPTTPAYLETVQTQLNRIEISLTDNNGLPLKFNSIVGTDIYVELHFMKRMVAN